MNRINFYRMINGINNGMKKFKEDNRGVGVIEVVLILVVLIALVIIFKDKITALLNSIFGSISDSTEALGV